MSLNLLVALVRVTSLLIMVAGCAASLFSIVVAIFSTNDGLSSPTSYVSSEGQP
jgi:hypothetical protein